MAGTNPANCCPISCQLCQNRTVNDPKDSRYKETGFPTLSWEEEDLATRPMPLHERPVQARVDSEMAVIARYHIRIALAIEEFWGHRDCIEFLQKLILNGGDGASRTRSGFKYEVVEALLNMIALQEAQFKRASP